MSREAGLDKALAHYRGLAARYDRATRLIDRIRLEAIEALGLRAGETVVDAGCGTGWCLPHLAARVGSSGRVIGFDPSPDMLAIAARRVAEGGLGQVRLFEASAQSVCLPPEADAVLFSYTHDLMQSPEALDRVLAAARPGARVAATSTKLYARWLWPLNAYLRYTHREYITNFERFEAPWGLLATRLDAFAVSTGPLTQHYVASGRVPQEARKTE